VLALLPRPRPAYLTTLGGRLEQEVAMSEDRADTRMLKVVSAIIEFRPLANR
jgi:hypothetical protein